ncbi:MAG: metallophosphoesterase family protein [Betaproteobacteria bacterium]
MPKILCAPDLHAWWPTFNRVGEDGIPSRLQDWRRSAQALLKAAIEHKVSAALFPGDFFPTSRPSPAQVLEVAQLFYRLEEEGIRVVGCKGNHDDLGPGQLSPVDLVARMAPDGRRWGWTQPGIERLPDLEVVVLPFTKAVKTDSDPAVAALETSQQLIQIARHWLAMADTSKPIVLMGHWAVSGCRLAAGNSLASTEPTLPLADLQTLPVRAAVMGHIHTPQVIATDPVVLHTGVLERHDFGEECNECGCYVVDLDTQEAEFIELPDRRFWTLELRDDQDVEAWLNGLIGTGDDLKAARDAVVRVVYHCTEELAARVDHSALLKRLEQESPHQIAGIFPDITRSERAREASVTETTSPLEALEKWIATRADISERIRKSVVLAAQALLKEVA